MVGKVDNVTDSVFAIYCRREGRAIMYLRHGAASSKEMPDRSSHKSLKGQKMKKRKLGNSGLEISPPGFRRERYRMDRG